MRFTRGADHPASAPGPARVTCGRENRAPGGAPGEGGATGEGGAHEEGGVSGACTYRLSLGPRVSLWS